MRILNVISGVDPESGGPTEVLRQQAIALAELGHVSEIATCDDPAAPFISEFPVKVHALGPGQGKFVFTPRLVPWLLDNAPTFDAVVIHGLWQYSGLGVWRAMRQLRRPYFVFCHGMLDPWFKREFPLKHVKKILYWHYAEYRILRDAKAVLYTCEEEKISSRQSFALYRAEEKIVPLGIARPEGDPCRQKEAFLAEFPILTDKNYLLFISRIHPKKGCDILIRAFAEVASQDAHQFLVMAGPDQVGWTPELQRLCESLGIQDRVIWTGMIKGDIKWGAYHGCSAFILPSHQENFGIVVAEALACGRPALISNKVNIWREVVEDRAGFAAQDDVDGTIDLLRRWQAEDSPSRSAIGKSASACFEKRFELRESTSEFLRVLQEGRA